MRSIEAGLAGQLLANGWLAGLAGLGWLIQCDIHIHEGCQAPFAGRLSEVDQSVPEICAAHGLT